MQRLSVAAAGLAGGLGVLLTALLVAGALALSGREFADAAALVVVAHLPVMVIEAVVSAAAIGLLLRLRPEALLGPLLLTGLMLGGATPAEAHKLKVFATAEGASVTGRAYFSSGDRARQGEVTVTTPDGGLVARLPLGDDGGFRFEAGQRADLRIRVDGGDGHVALYTLPAAELPDALPAGVAAAPAAAAPAVIPAVPPDLGAIIERSVARQVRPLREQLDSWQDTLWMHDLLGGLGVIFGLGGLAYGLTARRRFAAGERT
ncbi:MAG: energy-coupling factor ABC transporter permease [Rhodospirillaceae bacterium]